MTAQPDRPILHAIGNAHIDPVWLWRWPEGLETIRATFRSALDRINEYPDFIFTGSSAAFYAWLKDTDPALFAEVRERVKEGRWEIVGGWWIQPDANVPCGESLVRQALYGQRFFMKEFGVMATVGYNPDTFGHTGTLPQILSKAGLTRYIFMRPMEHEKHLPGNVFRWQSPDGSEVLASRIARAYGTWGDDLRDHVTASDQVRPPYVKDYMVFYGVGNHGGGPTRRNIDSIHALALDVGAPSTVLSSLDRFFSSVEAEIQNGAQAPVITDDLQHHARGCYTAESEVKRQNRRVEHLLMNAERFAAVAWSQLGHIYPQDMLTNAWQALLFNQFHDILAGSSLPEAYEDARDSFGYAASIANKVLYTSIQALSGRIDTRGPGDALVIYNPLPWAVTIPIEVERGSASITDTDGNALTSQAIQPTTVVGQRRSCFVADLPAMGYRLFRQDTAQSSADNPLFKPAAGETVHETSQSDQLRVSATSLENRFWRLEIDPASGNIASLFDKRNQVEVIAAPANGCIVIGDPSDTWSHDVVSFRNEIGRFGDARVAIEEDGPVRAALRIETRWGHSTVLQRLYLYRDIDVIECRLTVNWQEHNKMLKLSFPARLDDPHATYDIAYGSIARACNGEEEPGQQWIDVTGTAHTVNGEPLTYGVSLLNDSKYGYDVLDSELRMSLLRSPIYAYHDPYKPDAQREYVYQDQGIQTISYRIVPHAGNWQEAGIPRRAWELNVQPLWVNEYSHAGSLPAVGSFLNAEPASILLTVCKKAEDDDALIVRGYETAGRPVNATMSMPHLNSTWQAAFKAHEIKSWRIKSGHTPEVHEVDLLERIV